MNKPLQPAPALNRVRSLAGIAAFALIAAAPAWQLAYAQTPARAPMVKAKMALDPQYAAGLALEKSGDEKGAFTAFLAAAEGGYPPAQRKLGEIYDTGNAAVARNYEESIRWYQKAREGGEDIPPPTSRAPNMSSPANATR